MKRGRGWEGDGFNPTGKTIRRCRRIPQRNTG